MKELLLWGLGLYVLVVATWALYVASMHFNRVRDDLYIVAKIHAYGIVGVMLVLDFFLNVLMSVVFLEFPRELLLSPRLKRWNRKNDGSMRSRLAGWLCEHWLNQFDHTGDHC